MSPNNLSKEIAFNALREFFQEKPFLFIGTGMSCVVDNRFGMSALTDELVKNVGKICSSKEQRKQWTTVEKAIQNKKDLESALDAVSDELLLKHIISATSRFIASIDREYAFKIARCEVEWPAITLLKRLVETLPEGDRALHILTPNYDMLLEYACDCACILYTNGFSGGIERVLDWGPAIRSLQQPEQVMHGGKLKRVYKPRKHVQLYKVHGSLNYFYHHGRCIENNAWMWDPPDFAQRVMITPGLSKYEVLQKYRQELLQKADETIMRENHYLFLGYGFNDKHLEEYIKRKLVQQGCAGLIITMDPNPRIQSLLSQANNLWLVCKAPEPEKGTRIYNKQYTDSLYLPGQSLWDIAQFTREILGG
ncbi:MAG: SIR2 family protein [Dehalococcoidales bacterium]